MSEHIRLSEVARILGVPYDRIYKLSFTDDFPIKINGAWRRADIYDWMITSKRRTKAQVDELRLLDIDTAIAKQRRLKSYNAEMKRLSRKRQSQAEK